MPVHGHGQCERCGNNIEPCCSGANALDEASSAGGDACSLDAGLFARLFLQLGGATATVTTEALLFALVQRLGSDLDAARVVLEAAHRVGLVVPAGTGLHRLARAD